VEIPGSPLHPGQITEEELAYPEDLKPEVVFVTSSQADTIVGPAPKSYLDMMTKNGTGYIWHLLEDTWHDPTSVKPHLYNYLRMIFQ
jgi:glucuronoarabinoxylan endo-1,4-beta-xylanase